MAYSLDNPVAHAVSPPRFNLIDEPWIPCLRDANTPPTLLTLREVFAQAPRLWQIADPSPIVTISLYRLLLAILHRSLHGPRNAAEWARTHDAGAWDTTMIDTYLTTWRSRFDLFDARYPFYQTPGLSAVHPDAATVLTHERASGRNAALLFDHTQREHAWLTPAVAARALLAQHNFSVGGLISYDSSRESIANKYVKMTPLLKAAVCLVRGSTIFETLMLNWVQYSPDDAQPFPFHGDDLPAWERDAPTAPAERIPDGYVDLLTWQSRRILLLPRLLSTSDPAASSASSASGDANASSRSGGQLVVEQAVLMKGYQFSPAFERWTSETMVTFKKNPKASGATGGEPWSALMLSPDRVVWRDSEALFQSIPDRHTRPRTLTWLSSLMLQGFIDERRVLPLDVFGMIPDQANIEDWRHASLPLPLAILNDNAQLEVIGQALAFAEALGSLLAPYPVKLTHNGKSTRSPLGVLAEDLLVGTSGRAADSDARASLVESFGAPLRYWAQLDTPFRALVLALPTDVATDAYGQRQVGASALARWRQQVERAVRVVFQQVTTDLETSARTLRAVARAQTQFTYCLNTLLAPWNPESSPASSSGVSTGVTTQ